jgi:enoyl-CoA hydratase
MNTAVAIRPSLNGRASPAQRGGLDVTTSLVTVEESDRAVVARLTRPEKCNAISLEVIGELESLVQSLLRTGTSKPFVLRGSGRWFASGGDLRQFVTFTSEEAAAMAQRMADLLRDIERLPGPTIAALNGPAIGGGVELALAFDMRAASRSSYLRFAQTRIGITTGWQGIERLGRLVGYSTCLYLMLTGSQVPADDALKMGLVNTVWPDETFDAELDNLVQSLLQAGPAGVAVKRVLRGSAVWPALSSGDLEQGLLRLLWDRPERLEAMKAALSFHPQLPQISGGGPISPPRAS